MAAVMLDQHAYAPQCATRTTPITPEPKNSFRTQAGPLPMAIDECPYFGRNDSHLTKATLLQLGGSIDKSHVNDGIKWDIVDSDSVLFALNLICHNGIPV
ncbi:unnamed protein product [Tilletia laevis]|nr:unnamed protein product [Tilletia laevis]